METYCRFEYTNNKKDWLPDQLQTSTNLIKIALLLIDSEKRELLPTVLEFLHETTQQIIDENCVVRG